MKTICIYHSRDLDGWMSAAIVKHWFNQQEIPNKKGEDINTLDFLSWDYGDGIPNLSEYNQVIMVDISFPKEEMDKLLNRLDYKFVWIDHHISAIKDNFEEGDDYEYTKFIGLRNTKFAACELTWKYFFPEDKMPEIVRLLGMYDSFQHKGTDEEQRVLEFQCGARQVISNYEDAYKWLSHSLGDSNWQHEISSPEEYIQDEGETIYQYLCTEAKQIYKKAFPIKLGTKYIGGTDPISKDEKVKVHKYPFNFLCMNQERFNPINFGIDYHKDGYDGFACFWYKDNKWTFSLYNDNGEVDCSAIAKQYGGGGHKGAAGFVIDDISEFLDKNF